MNISPASRRLPSTSDPALSPKRDADGFAAATRKCLRGLLSRSLFRIAHTLQNWAAALDGETIDVPTSDVPPRPWSMADEAEQLLAEQRAELAAHDARSALLDSQGENVVNSAVRAEAQPARVSLANQPLRATDVTSRERPAPNIEPAALTKRTPPIKQRAALRDVGKGKA